jgi:hypothetical protein
MKKVIDKILLAIGIILIAGILTLYAVLYFRWGLY